LRRRGHQATLFGIADIEPLAQAEEIPVEVLGRADHPPGSFAEFARRFGKLHGLAAMRFGLAAAASEISMYLDEGPDALARAGVTALLIDQGEPAGSTLAERLGVPFVTVCNAAPADPDPWVPPTFTSWSFTRSWWGQLRNLAAYRLMDQGIRPLRQQINAQRRRWDLPSLRSLNETFSPLLEVAQQTRDFDFPRRGPPSTLQYVGLIERRGLPAPPFPFERLDGRPLVYASLGTVARDTVELYPALARACEEAKVQLALSLGGTTDPMPDPLPGDPIVVPLAPQLEVIRRASAVVCHGGNNTVLEALSAGVPVLAVPMNTDQYSVATRLRRSGAGDWLPASRLRSESLAVVLRRLLTDPAIRERSGFMARSIAEAGGTKRAADLIEAAIRRVSGGP